MIIGQDAEFSGWMFKKGKRVKNWKHRWFELRGDRLEYYETEKKGDKPINTIQLTKESRLEVLHDEDAPHDNIFLLQTETRDWKFSVETMKNRDEWMTQIKNNLPDNNNRATVTSFFTATGEVEVEGYLDKTGKWNTSWRRRWCKLLPRQKQLLYYEIDENKKKRLRDKINLNIVIRVDKEVSSRSHPHSFEMVTADRTYKFAADSAEKMEEWCRAIWKCVGGKQGQELQNRLLRVLLSIKWFPVNKSGPNSISIPDWLWHEVSDMMGNTKSPMKGEEKVDMFNLENSPNSDPEDHEYCPALLVHLMGGTSTLSFEAAIKLLKDVRKCFLSKPLLVDMKGPIYIVGQLNGDLGGLMNIFETLGQPPKTRYLFLGNIIGRQPESLGVALLLFALQVHYPKHICIIRGKMEDQVQTRSGRGTLYENCRTQYPPKIGRELWKEFVWVFDHMPICAVLNGKVFVVSSGLSENLTKVDALRRGKIRPLYIARTNKKKYPAGRLIGSVIVRDFLYNIPRKTVSRYTDQITEEDKGLVYYEFGKDDLQTFLHNNKFTKMVRSGNVNYSDDVFRNGHSSFCEDKLISINSSANYNYAILRNKAVKGAVMFMDEEGENFVFHTFKPDPNLLSTSEWSKERSRSSFKK